MDDSDDEYDPLGQGPDSELERVRTWMYVLLDRTVCILIDYSRGWAVNYVNWLSLGGHVGLGFLNIVFVHCMTVNIHLLYTSIHLYTFMYFSISVLVCWCIVLTIVRVHKRNYLVYLPLSIQNTIGHTEKPFMCSSLDLIFSSHMPCLCLVLRIWL